MEKGKIRKLNKELSLELESAQDFFIQEAENNTENYIKKYQQLDSSINGQYICSDLFKETFEKYTESINTRKKYSEVIHNSAAVLANELFQRRIIDPNYNKCIFLTGVPGAGKSFLVQSLALAGEIDDETLIYEGDITTPSIYEKIEKAAENGKELFFIVVNPTLELAQTNAINRSFEIGRGASCETMARIMSRIPNALVEIKERFPDINIAIYNKTTNYDIEYAIGFDNISMLDHGTYDEILEKLRELRLEILAKKKDSLIENQNLGSDNIERKK